jgi:hypothetical protein
MMYESKWTCQTILRRYKQKEVFFMGKDNQKENSNSLNSLPKNRKNNPNKMKEEISLELAELGNLTPRQEPMTPNQREKSESDKWYP